MNPDKPDQAPSPSPKPYTAPVLKVLGGVAAITATRSMSGSLMDGGPNNSKT